METKIKLSDLIDKDKVVEVAKQEQLNYLLNQEPLKEWVKVHPFIKGYKYIPIGIIEILLIKIFKSYSIEVVNYGMLLNAVACHVRLTVVSPVNGEKNTLDGVGAVEVQTIKDSGALKLDMSNINRGAIMMSLPAAKSFAIKDAAEHLGRLFGRDLNRKEADTLQFQMDANLMNIDNLIK